MEFYTCKNIDEMCMIYMNVPFEKLNEQNKEIWLQEFKQDPDVPYQKARLAGFGRDTDALRFLNR